MLMLGMWLLTWGLVDGVDVLGVGLVGHWFLGFHALASHLSMCSVRRFGVHGFSLGVLAIFVAVSTW